MIKKYDILIMVDAGIGNAIQALYSLEYLLRIKVKTGIFLGTINSSFQEYLIASYGSAIIRNLNDVECTHLIHGFTYQGEIFPKYNFYYYANPDFHSSKHVSETQQFLQIVRALYPSGSIESTLHKLEEDFSPLVQGLNVEDKTLLYPGGSSINSVRRWPHFIKLIEAIGSENCLIVGGNDDLNFSMSYHYGKLLSLIPQVFLNKKRFWKLMKSLGLLNKWSHHQLEIYSGSYFNQFSWAEMVYIFRRARKFIGNDGGLSHLAGACGIRGVVFFGPTSAKKNKPISDKIKVLTKNVSCSPCQFGVGKIHMTTGFINCPYQIRCLDEISVEDVLRSLNE